MSAQNRPLRVALINTFDIQGGAARAMWRLHQGLRSAGIASTVLCLQKTSNDPHCVQIDRDLSQDSLGRLQTWSEQERFVRSNLLPPYPYFTLPVPGYDIAEHHIVQEADIINLHWVAGFISPDSIESLQRLNKPIVWTLHDQRPFTGGCHYSNGCTRYESDCRECPILTQPCNHIHGSILAHSLDKYNPSTITVVTPSAWLTSCVKRSKAFLHSRVETIPYGLDTEIFRPTPKLIAHHKLGLAPGPLNLLIGSEDLNDVRKGVQTMLRALLLLIRDPDSMETFRNGKIRLLTFGKNNEMFNKFAWVTNLGVINNEEKLSFAYSAADVFICPTNEDNLPNTVLEAMSCQTPAIGTRVGGIPDMIIDQDNGWLIDPGDSIGLANLIKRHLGSPNLLAVKGERARATVVEKFNSVLQAERYETLYEHLLSI